MRFGPFVAVLLAGALCAGEGGGVGLGPAMILVRDVRPGQPVDLRAASGIEHAVSNSTGGPVSLEMVAGGPEDYGFASYECGYEPPPPGSFALDRSGVVASRHAIDLEVGGRAMVALVVALPDRPEYYNRHFVGYVEAGPPMQGAVGATLRLRARVLLETAPSAEHGGGVIGVAPSVAVLAEAGGTLATRLGLRNGGDRAAVLDLLPLSAVYAGDKADRRGRFHADAASAERAEQARPERNGIELAAGEAVVVAFAAPPGEGVEEVWLAARRALPDAPPASVRRVDGMAYDRMELLRLRYPGYQTAGRSLDPGPAPAPAVPAPEAPAAPAAAPETPAATPETVAP